MGHPARCHFNRESNLKGDGDENRIAGKSGWAGLMTKFLSACTMVEGTDRTAYCLSRVQRSPNSWVASVTASLSHRAGRSEISRRKMLASSGMLISVRTKSLGTTLK